jgi:hypothetical protein
MSQDNRHRTAQKTTMPLNERPMWGQRVEATLQGKEIKETAHARSAMTDTIRPYVDTVLLSDQQQSDDVNTHMSATAVTVLTANANRTPTSASREADTQVKRHDSVDEKLKDPYRPALFRRETVTSLDGLAGGIVMTMQQGCRATTRRQGLRNKKIFLLYLRNFPGHPCGQRDTNTEKKRLYMEETTPGQRSRSEIRPDRPKIPGTSTLLLVSIESLCSISTAFHRWRTGYCLGDFFMHTTLIL